VREDVGQPSEGDDVDNRVPVPAILAVILGAVAMGWILSKVRPGLPFTRRLLYMAIGGLVAGGLIYRVVLNQ
jgi:hypothetical protein